MNGRDRASLREWKKNKSSRRKNKLTMTLWSVMNNKREKERRIWELKRWEIARWSKESLRKSANLQSMKDTWENNKKMRQGEFCKEWKTELEKWPLMKKNWIDSSKQKGSKDKEKLMKTGKRKKEQESVYSIKSSMIGRRKLETTSLKEKMKRGRNNWIRSKWRREWKSMRHNRRERDRKNGREAKSNNKNYSNKSRWNKKEGEWFFKIFIGKSKTWRETDKITIGKSTKERHRVESNCKPSRKQIVYSDSLSFNQF